MPIPVRREPPGRKSRINVLLFSGGRGSSVLSKELISNPAISLVVVVNGYDDGMSTGEVRRFLGDSLGPSDFRKNASRLARELRSCPPELAEMMELRLPIGCSADGAGRVFRILEEPSVTAEAGVEQRVQALATAVSQSTRREIADRVSAFERERRAGIKPFEFSDCSLGNLVFAGCFLRRDRSFNAALDDYCGLLALSPGLVDNVTDGTNAFLVALDVDGRLLGSEGEIVDARRRNRIRDIYLIDHALTDEERGELAQRPVRAVIDWLDAHARPVEINPRILPRIADADLIIYSPGTQHSSLFPSYLTPGLSLAIARNLSAVKLLITNIQTDAEIAGSSAVDIIERARYYLTERGRLRLPTPALMTHYLVNDPGGREPETPYIPLGRLESLEDPRLVRIGHYEDGITGRHDATKVLTPFIESFLARSHVRDVAVWLYDSFSINKVSQTMIEMVRAGIGDLPLRVTVFCSGTELLDPSFVESLPFRMIQVERAEEVAAAIGKEAGTRPFDYVALFESSGMYNGEDIVSLASHLSFGRLDAVWGSRRLSVRDIDESLHLRYRHRALTRVLSRLGSHLLSLGYLSLYGRHIADTLSGARVVRASYLAKTGVRPDDKLANQRLLSVLLRQRAEVLEVPVQFLSLSPERVRRTSVLEGLRSLVMIAWWRVKAPCRGC